VARLERNARRRASRRGEAVAALTPGIGLLTRTNMRELRRLRDQTQARAQRLPRYRAWLSKLKVDQLTRMPSFEKRGEVGEAEMLDCCQTNGTRW
jgi:hypothetical protein